MAKRKPIQVTIETIIKNAGLWDEYQDALENHGDFHLKVRSKNYMPLVIEITYEGFVSVAHMFTQYGDTMRDPEIVFDPNRRWLPVEITQDPMGVYRRAPDGYYLRGANKLARVWAKNLRFQGFPDGEFSSLTHKESL